MRGHHYNPTQAGMDVLKACETFRKVLMANIDPFMPLEAKIEAKARTRAEQAMTPQVRNPINRPAGAGLFLCFETQTKATKKQ